MCFYPSTTPPTATSAISSLPRPCPAKSARSPDTAGMFEVVLWIRDILVRDPYRTADVRIRILGSLQLTYQGTAPDTDPALFVSDRHDANKK